MLTLKKFLLNTQLLHQLLGQLSGTNERGYKKAMILPWDQMNMMTMMTGQGNQMI